MKKYSDAFLIDLYKKMLRVRLCEESFVTPILEGKIKCPVHLCSGQEAVAGPFLSHQAQAPGAFSNLQRSYSLRPDVEHRENNGGYREEIPGHSHHGDHAQP